MAVEWVQDAVRERLGFTAYPATLNLRPAQPEGVARWEQVRRVAEAVEISPPDLSFCHALCFRVEVTVPSSGDKVRGAVLLPQVLNYPADKIEIVAPMNIKQSLGVRDGDRLTLEFFEH